MHFSEALVSANAVMHITALCLVMHITASIRYLCISQHSPLAI